MDQVEGTQVSEEPKKPVPAKDKKLSLIIWILVAVIVLLGAYTGYAAYKDSKSKSAATVSPTASIAVSPIASKTSDADRVKDEGVAWIDPPERLGDLGLFEASKNSQDGDSYKETLYYKVATTTAGSEIILAKIKVEGMGSFYSFQRFIKQGDQYSRLEKNSDQIKAEAEYQLVSGKSSTDGSTVFKSILPDHNITLGQTELVFQEFETSNVEFADSTKGDKISETKWGSLYRLKGTELYQSNGSGRADQYFVKLNDSVRMGYEPKAIFSRDDGTFDLEFTAETESANSIKFEKMKTGGCGLGAGSFPVVASANSISGKKLLGKTSGSTSVYYLDDVNNDWVKYGYKMYSQGRTDAKPIADFAKNYGLVIWQDAYDSTIIYMNSEYSPQSECGKPVIYLYPEKTINVVVKVGAQITKSEPAYQGSWQATAEPSGKLTVAGKTYPYLFWEGLGYGLYPEVKSGTIVPLADVQKTVEKQLSYIGLNQKEIGDFLEFWMPKMPASNYVRLTWLQNKQMDQLAPISVIPAPQSTIRVFLEFSGLDSKIALPKQDLIKMNRAGYTLVEWGGLLR